MKRAEADDRLAAPDEEPVLIVGSAGEERLQRALARAGLAAELVPRDLALARAAAGAAAVLIAGPRDEALTLCADLKTRLEPPLLPVALLHAPRGPVDAPARAPDAWIPERAPAREIARRVRELVRLRQADRRARRLEAELAAVREENGRLHERARREAESTARLLRELQHRVRNNLASIQALLVLERHREPPRPLREALDVAIARLRTMAALHESGGAAPDAVDLASVARSVARSALELFGEGHPIALEIEGEATVPARVGSALALVLNELVTNAVQHAGARRLRIDLAHAERELRLTVHDDGRGIPGATVPGSGLRIARTVIETELHGALAVGAARPGTAVEILVPVPRTG